MIVDLTPTMTGALASIGKRSVTASEMAINGGVLKRLWELGFLKMDLAPQGVLPPYYSLSAKGEGAAAILTAKPCPIDRESPVARIKRVVAGHYRIPVDEMISARRSKVVARPRQVAMYLTKKLTPKSLPDIGRNFGNRDHTTVIHAVRTVERLMEEDSAFKEIVKTLFGELVSDDRALTVESRHIRAFAEPLASA